MRTRLKPQRQELQFKVQVKIVEGKNLAGTQLDPIVDVHCFGEKMSSKQREQTNNPTWDEVQYYFVISLPCEGNIPE